MKKHLIPLLFIIFVWLIVVIRNYTPATWLSGWDTIHPEFNFLLNIKRSLFAVWQEYQGVGLLGGMAHAADLPRQIILFIFSLILPAQILRYIWTFGMLLFGPLGAYVLVFHILKRFKETARDRYIKSAAMVAGLFYLLNLATLQSFFAPYDVFVTHYGFFPWLIWSTLLLIDKVNQRNLVLFIALQIIGMTAFYVPTLFLVYLITVVIIGVGKFWLSQNRLVLRNLLILLATVFIINAFWLIPFMHFTLSHSQTVVNSKINTMATEDDFLRNKKYGTIVNTLTLKNFWFDANEYYPQINARVRMLGDRDKYISQSPIQLIGLIISLYVIFGFIICFRKKELRIWALLGLVGFTFLTSATPPFSWIVEILRSSIPLLSQFFRFPFTKWSTELLTTFSIFLGVGVYVLCEQSEKRRIPSKLVAAFFIILILIFNASFFFKDTITPAMRVKIPPSYFQMFDFFKQQPLGRIAILPQENYWDWKYYQWGQFGSGFIWYGIEQPILDRAFDNWSDTDQNYYWELSQAIYSNDANAFLKALEKYQVKWLMVDKSITDPSAPKSLYFDRIDSMILNLSNNIRLAKTFGNINIYEINLESNTKDFVFLTNNLPKVGPTYKWNNFDKTYDEYGNYISVDSESKNQLNNEIFYPFRSLFTGRKQEELEFQVEDKGEYFLFHSNIPKDLIGAKLLIPPISHEESIEIDKNELDKIREVLPQIFLDGELVNIDPKQGGTIDLSYIKEGNFEIRVPKIGGYYSDQFLAINNQSAKSCDQFNTGTYKRDVISESGDKFLRLTSIGSSNCLDFDLPYLTQRLGYLVTVKSSNIHGKSLLFAVINKNSERSDTETYLPKKNESEIKNQESGINTSYFIIPPMEQYGMGYTIHIDNISIGREQTINDLGKITINPIPYNFLTSLKIVKGDKIYENTNKTVVPSSVGHPNPSFYQIEFGSDTQKQIGTDTTLVLSQGFDFGWHAYQITNDWLTDSWYMKLLIPMLGKELKNHVMVNNWENGWEIKNPQKPVTIVLFYLPQYLEYLGFGLLGVSILFLLLTKQKKIP